MSNFIPMPAPYRGQNDKVPLTSLTPEFCEISTNFNLDDTRAVLRHGDSIFATKSGKLPLNLSTYGSGGSEVLFMVYDNGGATGLKVDDISSGTPSTVYAPGGVGGDDEIQTLFFNNYLFFFGEVTWRPSSVGNPTWNGSAWGLSGYTYSTMTTPFGGCVYKNRAYILEKGSSKFAYSGIASISGAMTEVDLSQIISRKGNLYGIRSVSLSEGVQQENVLCFIFDTGEVLVYAGSYPNSADWGLVGRFVVSPPVYYNSFVDARGDSFIITISGLVSLRSLFTQGASVAVTESLSKNIPTRWKQVFGYDWASTGLNICIKGSYDQSKDRIIITLPFYVSRAGGNPSQLATHRMIYSFRTGSWTEHVVVVPSSLLVVTSTMYKNNFYYGETGGVLKAEASSGFVDDLLTGSTYAVQFQLRLAPIPSQKTNLQKLEGWDLIMKSDLYSEATYQVRSDLGTQSSDYQAIPLQSTSLIKSYLNLGIEGSFIQLDVIGDAATDKTVGLEYHAYNAIMETGSGSR